MRRMVYYTKWTLVLLSLLGSACGGGGGDSTPPKPQFSVASNTVSFSASVNDASAPSAKNLLGTIVNATTPVYLFISYTNNALASVSVSVTGPTSGQLTIFPKAPGPLGIGSFTDTITVKACLDPAGTQQMQGSPQTISVTYLVANLLRPTPSSVAFSYILGAAPTPADQTIGLAGNGLGWRVTASPSWVQVRTTQGTAPFNLEIGLDPAGLSIGHYSGTVAISTIGTTDNLSIPVVLDVIRPTLVVNPGGLSVGGAGGKDLRPLAFQVSLNTGTQVHAWTAVPDQSWINLDATAGQASSTPTTIKASWDCGALSAGGYSGSILVTATVAGETLTASVPVTLLLDARRLLAETDGVALVSVPGLAKTTTAIQIRDNLNLATHWKASADQPWLAVTASGVAPGALTLAADPSGLSADTVHYANVQIDSLDGTTVGSETVRVGFWVGSTSPAATTTINSEYSELIMDSIRPYAYVHNGGPILSVYNIYTGALVQTITTASANLGKMTISSDGSHLYLADNSNHQIIPILLADFSLGLGWPLGILDPPMVEFSRANGKPFLVSGNGHIFDAATGRDYGALFPASTSSRPITCSREGGRFITYDYLFHPTSFSEYTLDCRTVFSELPIVSITSWSPPPYLEDVTDAALNWDGSRVYLGDGASYDASVPGTSAVPLAPLGAPSNNNVETTLDGRIFTAAGGPYKTPDVWIFRASDGALLRTIKVSGYSSWIVDRQLKVSGDGLRMAAIISNNPALVFVSVAP